MPDVTVVAGPNGAGKTTAFRNLVPKGTVFLSADDEDGQPYEQARTTLRRMRQLEHQGRSFCIETTLSGRLVLSWLERWRRNDYETRLIFISLPDPELAIARVRLRVREGGHDIPGGVQTISDRYKRGLYHFFEFRDGFDYWTMYDNRDINGPVTIAVGSVSERSIWSEICSCVGGRIRGGNQDD
jgi:predicted ABC-type ATPase